MIKDSTMCFNSMVRMFISFLHIAALLFPPHSHVYGLQTLYDRNPSLPLC